VAQNNLGVSTTKTSSLTFSGADARFTQMEHIEINPQICAGRPVIKGTRITVQTILGFLSAGDSPEDVIEGYPQLTREDILACLTYARRLGETHSVVALAS
jgi:uncharacterized protein (DUF433 family)